MNKKGEDAVKIPIDGILDLHAFNPKDVPSVVREYLRACREKGIYDIRIIHGKGKGILLSTIHSLLKRYPGIQYYGIDPGSSGWGATMVRLKEEQGHG